MENLDYNVSKTIKWSCVCQVDWDGYTIGYYGRIFEARNKTKGGSFEVSTRFCFLLVSLAAMIQSSISVLFL